MPECATPPAKRDPDFAPVGRNALGSPGVLNGGWKLTVCGTQALASRHTTVCPALIETVSGSNRLKATSLSPQLAVTVAPVPVGAGGRTEMGPAWAPAEPSSFSAAAAHPAGDNRPPSEQSPFRVP